MYRIPLRGLWAAAALTLVAVPAGAFCRATSCLADPEAVCSWDGEGCVFEGVPLGWPLGTTIRIELDADSLDEAERAKFEAAVEQAIAAWLNVRCEAGTSLGLGGAGGEGGEGGSGLGPGADPASGGTSAGIGVKMVSTQGDVVVRPVAEDWPYSSAVAGKTTLEFGLTSGEISAATLELNFVDYEFVERPRKSGEINSVAVLTHELGHVLGLDHSRVQGATMESETSAGYSSSLRSLEPDDGDALCSIYPPEQDDSPPEEVDLSDDVKLKDNSSKCQQSPANTLNSRGAGSWLLGSLFCALGLTLRRVRRLSV